jgi:ABC-type polysaccharide/polyol phosphate transport system ATPase subunit
VVLVSHSAPTIMELCDRAVWIEDGVSRVEGPVREVLAEYNDFLKSGRRM